MSDSEFRPGRTIGHPVFAQPEPTADPTTFRIKHASDKDAYAQIDELNKEHKLHAMTFPKPRGGAEPQLTLADVLDDSDAKGGPVAKVTAMGQIVFHAGGDCGPTQPAGLKNENAVVDKMISDYDEVDPKEVPQFLFLLGDVVYSFGEVKYYYDQFYEPFRDYPAPILAAAGNHDGLVSPETHAKSLEGYLRNFCAKQFIVQPEALGLSRTAQIQPGVFFTFEAPFVRLVAFYSNVLEDPGVIADDKDVGQSQLDFLKAAFKRVSDEQYKGALLIADHHPPYTGVANTEKGSGSRHGWSPQMLAQIDDVCNATGVWPHAFLSGHSHNYQRFTRTVTDAHGTQREIPYVVCGNLGHNVTRLSKQGATIRTPQVVQKGKTDQVVFDNYDDADYGYLRVIASQDQLRIEYHPASDGAAAKTPDDAVTVDLASRTLTTYKALDLGQPEQTQRIRRIAKEKGSKPRWMHQK
jgi:hypothetical protein